MMARWKGVVFDFDGTLLSSHLTGRERFINIAVSLNLPVSEIILDHIKKMWGAPGYVLIQTSWPDACTQDFMHQWETFDSKNPLSLFPGTREMVQTLSTTRHISLLTSRSWSTHFQLRHHAIDSFFSFVCTLEDSPAPKPDPRSIEPLLHLYGVHHRIGLKDLVLVGDSVQSDYELARIIGMDFIAVSWGNNTREDFLAAGVKQCNIVDSIDHLLCILNQ